MAIGDKIFVADKETLDKAKNIVDNIQYIVKKSTTVPAPPALDKDYVADKETLDEMYSTLDGITTFSLNGNATAAQVLSGRTFFSNSPTRQTGTMANRSTQTSTSSYTAATFRSGTTGYVFCSPSVTGYYTTSSYLRVPVSNLSAANIKYNVNVGGIQGTYTNDGTATAGDLGVGKIAYSKGTRLVGTGENVQFSLVLQGLTSNPVIDTLEDITVASNILCFLGHGGVYSANTSDYSSAYQTSTNNPSYGTRLGTVYGEGGDNGDPRNIIASMGNYVIWGEGSSNSYPTSLHYRTATSNSGTSTITLPYVINRIYGITVFNNKVVLCTDDGFYYSTSINGTYTKATTSLTPSNCRHFNEINGRLYATSTWLKHVGDDELWYTDDGITWNYITTIARRGYLINDYATNGTITLLLNDNNTYRVVNNGTPSLVQNQDLDAVDYYNGYFYGYYDNKLYRSSDGITWSAIYTFTLDTDEDIIGQFVTSELFIISTEKRSFSFNTINNTAIEIPKIPIDQEGVFRKPYRNYNGKKVSLINTKTVAIFNA